MSLLLEALPKNSLLHLWLEASSILETPVSYDLIVGISCIGALLRRSCWYDQKKFKIYPNVSSLLVGGSGTGKDTAINNGKRFLKELDNIAVIGGKTSETITDRLAQINEKQHQDVAAAVLCAGEFAEFFGPKDYQSSLLQTITDLLSNNEYVDISLKSTGFRRVLKPTLTVIGGSTKEWLHDAMPESSLSGGFYPRFLIVNEHGPKRLVALVDMLPEDEVDRAMKAEELFTAGGHYILKEMCSIGKIGRSLEAAHMYIDWYAQRKAIFSPTMASYAHRCRDNVLRMATICAVSRSKANIDTDDMHFAITVMNHVAKNIDEVLAPPTLHLRVKYDIMKLLPSNKNYIWQHLEKKYDPYIYMKTWHHMRDTGQLLERGGLFYSEV